MIDSASALPDPQREQRRFLVLLGLGLVALQLVQSFWVFLYPAGDDLTSLTLADPASHLVGAHVRSGRYVAGYATVFVQALAGGAWLGAPVMKLATFAALAGAVLSFFHNLPFRLGRRELAALSALAVTVPYKMDLFRFEIMTVPIVVVMLASAAFFALWPRARATRGILAHAGLAACIFVILGTYQLAVYFIAVFLVLDVAWRAPEPRDLARDVARAASAVAIGGAAYFAGLLMPFAGTRGVAGRIREETFAEWLGSYALLFQREAVGVEPFFPAWLKIALLAVALLPISAWLAGWTRTGRAEPTSRRRLLAGVGLVTILAMFGAPLSLFYGTFYATRGFIHLGFVWPALLALALLTAPRLGRRAVVAVATVAVVVLLISTGAVLFNGYRIHIRSVSLATRIVYDLERLPGFDPDAPMVVSGIIPTRMISGTLGFYRGVSTATAPFNIPWARQPFLRDVSGYLLPDAPPSARSDAEAACATAEGEGGPLYRVVKMQDLPVVCLQSALPAR